MTIPRSVLALLVTLAVLVGVLATLLVTQAVRPGTADAGSGDSSTLRNIDRNIRGMRYQELFKLHRDLEGLQGLSSDIAKSCRAIAERSYDCPLP